MTTPDATALVSVAFVDTAAGLYTPGIFCDPELGTSGALTTGAACCCGCAVSNCSISSKASNVFKASFSSASSAGSSGSAC